MPAACNHPVTKYSSLERSVKGAMKLWHRCTVCGLPVLVKVYYGTPDLPAKTTLSEISLRFRNRAESKAA
ncbi:MAG: hypothetical protein OEM52_06930 [bacterium]|nr:hypothetical protein [bacterium]